MKKHLSTIILIVILFIGLSLLLYPTVSDYWNSLHQTRAIADYSEAVSSISPEEYEKLWNDAREYNGNILSRDNLYLLEGDERETYLELLNISGNGIMGYIDIPSIQCTLPIYHGTDATILQIAVGHIDWTSLPTGGGGTHCVLSGHRGLPSAKLFSDLDELQNGDLFMLTVLDEILTYEVDQILIVEPQEINSLLIEPGKDYCTLVTCTPYGINSHRLLVRGHRVETEKEAEVVRVTADALLIEPVLVAPLVAIPILLVLLILLLIPKGSRKKNGGASNETS